MLFRSEGGNPLDSIAETELESVWNKIPESIRIFYENIQINCDINSATLWFSDDQPEYNLNFWDVVDEWTKIGLQDI